MHFTLPTISPILVTYAPYAPMRMNNKGLRSAPLLTILPTAYVELLLFYHPQVTRVCVQQCVCPVSLRKNIY